MIGIDSISLKAKLIFWLKQMGYERTFVVQQDGFWCMEDSELFRPEEFEIAETVILKSGQAVETEPIVIFAIHSGDKAVRGILITPYNAIAKYEFMQDWSMLTPAVH